MRTYILNSLAVQALTAILSAPVAHEHLEKLVDFDAARRRQQEHIEERFVSHYNSEVPVPAFLRLPQHRRKNRARH
jgi:hypothetical protein